MWRAKIASWLADTIETKQIRKIFFLLDFFRVFLLFFSVQLPWWRCSLETDGFSFFSVGAKKGWQMFCFVVRRFCRALLIMLLTDTHVWVLFGEVLLCLWGWCVYCAESEWWHTDGDKQCELKTLLVWPSSTGVTALFLSDHRKNQRPQLSWRPGKH